MQSTNELQEIEWLHMALGLSSGIIPSLLVRERGGSEQWVWEEAAREMGGRPIKCGALQAKLKILWYQWEEMSACLRCCWFLTRNKVYLMEWQWSWKKLLWWALVLRIYWRLREAKMYLSYIVYFSSCKLTCIFSLLDMVWATPHSGQSLSFASVSSLSFTIYCFLSFCLVIEIGNYDFLISVFFTCSVLLKWVLIWVGMKIFLFFMFQCKCKCWSRTVAHVL
jgi:hypothetical protein